MHKGGTSFYLGQVHETNEDNARCAALSKFSIHPDDDVDPAKQGIREDDEFDVSEAL